MRKALALSVIITILAVIAYFTKPSEEACVAKAKDEFVERKIVYTAATMPEGIDPKVFVETSEKSFLQSLQIEDKFLYNAIYQVNGNAKKKIGWAAFGWINVDVK